MAIGDKKKLIRGRTDKTINQATMAPTLSEDQIDDLLYLARVGEKGEFISMQNELCEREKCTLTDLLEAARDNETSGNGVLHMAAANGHDGEANCLGYE